LELGALGWGDVHYCFAMAILVIIIIIILPLLSQVNLSDQILRDWWSVENKNDHEGNCYHYQSILHFKVTLDINFHWNQRTLKFCRFCRRPLWKWRPFSLDFFWVSSSSFSSEFVRPNSQRLMIRSLLSFTGMWIPKSRGVSRFFFWSEYSTNST
jgi:hypothetical protein